MNLKHMLWIAAAVVAGAYVNSLLIRPTLGRMTRAA